MFDLIIIILMSSYVASSLSGLIYCINAYDVIRFASYFFISIGSSFYYWVLIELIFVMLSCSVAILFGTESTHISIFTVRKWSCRKVMFLHLSVSHSVHRGVSASVHAGIYYPLLGRHPLGRHPPGQTPPCPVHAGIHTPCPLHAGIHITQCMLG